MEREEPINGAFVTEIVPIVENGIINKENVDSMLDYMKSEVIIDKLVSNYNIYNPSLNHFAPLYKEVQDLLDIDLPNNIIDKITHDGNERQSINPTYEIIGLLDHVKNPKQTPENCAVITIKYNDIIIGYISVIVDSRTEFAGTKSQRLGDMYRNTEKVGYFIGIRKSSSLMAAQQYSKYSTKLGQIYKSLLTEFRLSEKIIPVVEDYARSLNCGYLVSTPLGNMIRILVKYFGFNGPQLNNTVTNRKNYDPPVYLISQSRETIVWRKISYDDIY